MTEELFRNDAYLRSCSATVVDVTDGEVILDQTVCYPEGGGQPGDQGTMTLANGETVKIIDTRKGDAGIRHILDAESDDRPAVGETVNLEIDWDRRYKHMRMHTLLHLVCAVVEGEISGAGVGAEKSRVDFNLPDTSLDKQVLTDELNARIQTDADVRAKWITDEELEAQPELIKTMTVRPPMG